MSKYMLGLLSAPKHVTKGMLLSFSLCMFSSVATPLVLFWIFSVYKILLTLFSHTSWGFPFVCKLLLILFIYNSIKVK